MSFIILEPIVFNKYKAYFKLAAFVVFGLLVTECH